MNKYIITVILFLSFLSSYSQVKVTWENLKDVKFTEKYNEELGAYIQDPAFGEKVKMLSGKEILISGFVIPLDIKNNIYVLSGNPFASCFFCGGGGPESVMDMRFVRPPRRYKTDEKVTFRGRLKLNKEDIYSLNYILENAVAVE